MNNEQRGVALLIVLMLLALMAALAADMTLSFHSQLQRTRQVNHHLQRQYDIELAEKLALASLTQDVKDNDRQTTLQQYWAQPQQLQLEDGNTVKWQLRDAQHCFNLNALAKISDDPLASPDFPAQVFSALLINAGIDRGNTDEIVQSIADYIDVDDSPRFHGAEDSFYQSQTPPRHSANQMLFLTGELRQIKGIPDNTQDWHWTVVDKQNESVEVIGIQSEKLSRYLERLHTAGLNVTRVLPDGCYLPWEVDSWTLVNQQKSWLIRSAAHAFNELDEHWLQHLAAQFPPENMLCYGVVPHGVAAANPLIQHPEIPSLSLYSADIAFQRYDMLHGIFRKQKTVSKSGKWLARLAVSCLVLAILSFVGSRSIALWHTLKIEDQLQQQQQETWQRYFPQIKRTHNFHFYFKQQLAQQYPEAVPLLYHLQTLLLEHPELQLMEANYSQKQKSLTLKMSAKSEANIDRFCELTQSWLPMEKTEKDPVSGVWTVRNSGK